MKVIFFHLGFAPYLEHVIKQSSHINPTILIGDDSNAHLGSVDNVVHFNYNDHNKDVQRFLNSYRHLNTNNPNFEILSFIRWICLRNVMQAQSLDVAFHSDSDNLIYSCIQEAYSDFNKPDLGLSIPDNQPDFRWAATGEASYWNLNKIEAFCEFLLSLYEDKSKFTNLLEPKWTHHKENNLTGGVCDMTALWHFSQLISPATILTSIYHKDSSFDHSINNSTNHLDNEYRMNEGVKEIKMENNHPYGYNLIHNKKVKFHNLQFQGPSKNLLSSYITYND